MNDWDQYPGNRKFKQTDHFIMIVPENHQKYHVCCLLCNTVLHSADDNKSIDDFGCCYACAMKWVHPNRSRWVSGWRPDAESVKLEISSRTPSTFIFEF
jgi:hypothetical protein